MHGLGGYAPGNPADVHPPGTATFVPAGSKLMFQMHYTPNGTARRIAARSASSSPIRRR